MKLPPTLSALLIFSFLLVGCRMPTTDDTTPPETSSAPASDPCLQGNWVMSNEDLNSTMQALTGIPNLSIPTGTLVMSFTGDDFSYASDNLTLRMDMSDGYMEAEAGFLFTALFSTSNGIITFTDTVYDAETFVWRAVINGEVSEIAGQNTLRFPVPGSGPYGCSADALTFEAISGATGPVVLLFTRQR
ncbi:MAG: hypothetical protein ABWK53_10130 [Anaerolineales bacterium]